MHQHLLFFMMSIQPKVRLTETEFENTINWLKLNYMGLFEACSEPRNRNDLFQVLKRNPDNWIAVMSYADICYEHKDFSMIEKLQLDKDFSDSSNSINMYLDLRKEFSKGTNNELEMWKTYVMGKINF